MQILDSQLGLQHHIVAFQSN